MKHELDITITPDGEIEIKVMGVNGPQCIKTTDFLTDDALEVISQELTGEYYKNECDNSQTIKGQ